MLILPVQSKSMATIAVDAIILNPNIIYVNEEDVHKEVCFFNNLSKFHINCSIFFFSSPIIWWNLYIIFNTFIILFISICSTLLCIIYFIGNIILYYEFTRIELINLDNA